MAYTKTIFTRGVRLVLGVRKLEFDFTECTFLEPFHVVSLACLYEELNIKGIKFGFLNLEERLRSYLESINFLNYWEAQDKNQYIPSNLGTSLCLWQVEKTRINEHVTVAQEYFENNFLKGKNLDLLNISLAELFNNILDHSNSAVFNES